MNVFTVYHLNTSVYLYMSIIKSKFNGIKYSLDKLRFKKYHCWIEMEVIMYFSIFYSNLNFAAQLNNQHYPFSKQGLTSWNACLLPYNNYY